MSFLNPVNEPVLRFSSTDADAPQINYNARVAGDVKAVLKACLVTGYGAISSAGWTAENEVGNVVEFVSPGAAMSDYRLGIDDSVTSRTTWYYQYQNIRTDPTLNAPTRDINYAVKTHSNNGWQLLVTERGIVFVELVQHAFVNRLSARITYWGAVKSAINDTSGGNICFFNVGHSGTITQPYYFYDRLWPAHIALATHVNAYISAATSNALSFGDYAIGGSNVDLISPIYFASGRRDALVAELPPMLSKIVNSADDTYGISESLLDGRNVLSVCAGGNDSVPKAYASGRTFLIRTDYWEY